jgi:glycerophosphoryl diester phosphodiesterase
MKRPAPERTRGPLVIAHRGASAYAPENTEAAVRLAVRQRADAIECDVQLSSDGVPIVFHDANLRRLCGERERVDALPARELVRRRVSVAGRRGEPARVVTLARWLALLPARVLPVVELKRQRTPAAERRLARAVARVVARRRGAIVMISFSPGLVAAARRARRDGVDSEVAPIRNAPPSPALLRRLARSRPALVVTSWRIATASVVAALRRAGKELWCYTVDDPAMMRALLRRGVTGLISNRPDVARRVVDRFERMS